MKNLIKILLLISFLFSSSTQSIGIGMGGGILSEKVPMSFIEFSAYYSPNQKTEYFGVFSYMVFGAGIGAGIKKYRNDKKGITPFISAAYSTSIVGDGYDSVLGPSLAVGYYFSFRELFNFIDEMDMVINIGAGSMWNGHDLRDRPFIYPFLTGEMKVDIDLDILKE